MGRRIVVLGATGQVGRALLAAAAAENRASIGTYHQRPRPEMRAYDATKDDLGGVVEDLNPRDAVVLLAGNNDASWVFENPEAARTLNVEAPLAAAARALEAGARVILVSSEMVFDGVRGAYAEADVTTPTTLLGRQKVEVEEALRAAPGSWAVVRTGWNVGWEKDPRCPVFTTYRTLLARGARMAEDNLFTLTDANDTAAAILRLADRDECGLWHVASAPAVSRTDLAGWVVEGSRHRDRMAYDRVRFADLPQAEPQPERSWIVNHKAVQNLQLSFAEPWRTVERKVALIDQWYDDRQKRLGRTRPLT